MTSEDELLRQINRIRSGQSAIDNLPNKVQEWHGNLVSLLRTNAAAAAATGNVTAPVLAERQVDLVWRNRDEINSALGETGDRLAEMKPGLNVPVEFVAHAAQWRSIKNDINNAFTAISETVLYTEWQGDASNRYRDIHQRQGLACTSLAEAAAQIADSLETVAEAELALYSDLATKVQDMVTTVTNLTGSYISSALNFPMGYIQASSNLVSAVQASNTLVIGLATSIADNALKNMIEGNKVYDAVAAPRGLPAGQWPPAVVTSYGYGVEAVRDAIGDGSVSDGDKSDWEL